MLATAGKDHPRVMVGIYIPLIVIAALCSALFMDNLEGVRNDRRAMRDAARNAHTWVIAVLYIATFGSFIGFSFAFGQVLQVQFAAHFLTAGKADPVKIASLTFLGPLVGSLARPAGGWLADRFGGARTTFWNFALMALAGGGGARRLGPAVASAVLRRVHRAVRAVRARQRLDLQDDPRGPALPGGGECRRSASRERSARSAAPWSTWPSASRSSATALAPPPTSASSPAT